MNSLLKPPNTTATSSKQWKTVTRHFTNPVRKYQIYQKVLLSYLFSWYLFPRSPRKLNKLNDCNIAAAIHSSRTQWPGPHPVLKRVHADFRSSFLNNYDILIVIDFCCMPLAFLAKIRLKNFAISDLRLTCSCEGMWSVLMTAHGTDYFTEVVNERLRNAGICNGFIYDFGIE